LFVAGTSSCGSGGAAPLIWDPSFADKARRRAHAEAVARFFVVGAAETQLLVCQFSSSSCLFYFMSLRGGARTIWQLQLAAGD